jgi:hypothetical protein
VDPVIAAPDETPWQEEGELGLRALKFQVTKALSGITVLPDKRSLAGSGSNGYSAGTGALLLTHALAKTLIFM